MAMAERSLVVRLPKRAKRNASLGHDLEHFPLAEIGISIETSYTRALINQSMYWTVGRQQRVRVETTFRNGNEALGEMIYILDYRGAVLVRLNENTNILMGSNRKRG